MKNYLLETFKFNDVTNKKLPEKIFLLPDKNEAIRHFSHLINCQYKWMARIKQDPDSASMSWWEPLYPFAQLQQEWNKSLLAWIEYLTFQSDENLEKEVTFIGFDGGQWAAKPKDIALQLNYHSIHHRAQIQILIRAQGIDPDFVDYIASKYRKLS